MNNPKEEAKRLVDRFDYQVRDNDGECALTRDESKQCALICVEEIKVLVKEMPNDINLFYAMHYDKVKKEIEAL
jgi:hypothetical protein